MDRPTEIRRVAQVLHKSVGDLNYLNALSAEQLSVLRHAIQNGLLDRFESTFRRMAKGGKLIPDAINALLCKKVFGPTLTANMSYYTPAELAASMCSHFDADFMTAVAREQIPDRAIDLLDDLPVELMRDVMRNLLESDDYHIMGAFTDALPDDKVLELMGEIIDPADNLRISSFAQRKDRIAALTNEFEDDTLRSLIDVARDDVDLQRENALIIANLSDDRQVVMAAFADEVDTGFRAKLKKIADAEGIADLMQAYFNA